MNTTLETQLDALMAAVDRAIQAGNNAEADQAIAQARALAPDHPGVLNVAGMRALALGDASTARSLLERAAGIDPAPLLWVNIALAHRELGDPAGERDALEKALQMDPRYFPALLHKGRLFEREGKLKAAAYMYYAFLRCLPSGVPPTAPVQEAIVHAQRVLGENNRALEAFLAPRVEAARARHRGESLERFDACLQTLLGKRRLYRPEPTFMLFPRLPAIEFIERAHYPWLDGFEAASGEIRAEALAALAGATTCFLLESARPQEAHLARCPRTAALLESAPLCEIAGHAPTAFFSVLPPHTRTPPQTGASNTRFIVYLPLVVPPGCSLRVGAERLEWREGHAWIFDDTFEHEAINDSDQPALALVFDVWNCFLTPAERDLVAAVTAGVQAYNEGEAPFRPGG